MVIFIHFNKSNIRGMLIKLKPRMIVWFTVTNTYFRMVLLILTAAYKLKFMLKSMLFTVNQSKKFEVEVVEDYSVNNTKLSTYF
jgi:hypothetical protein